MRRDPGDRSRAHRSVRRSSAPGSSPHGGPTARCPDAGRAPGSAARTAWRAARPDTPSGASARAADRDGQVVAVVARVVGQPARDEVVDVAVHALDFGIALEEVDDGGVACRSAAQRRLVVRIGQAAHVEHEVGVERHAVLEAERLEQQRELATDRRDEVLDPARAAPPPAARSCRTRSRAGARRREARARTRSLRSACASSLEKGWRRRVSEKRLTSVSVLASR